jgi:hypothetical protein
MSQVLIRKALEKHLATMSPSLSTANENVNFIPVTGTPYQRINLLPATPDNPTIGGNHYLELGIFQITLCYPMNAGANAAQARAELIKAHFPRVLSLTESTLTLTITRTPAIATAFIDGDRYCIPVSIQYHANIN